MTMEHVHIQRGGDREKLIKYNDMFDSYSNKELIDSYNSSVNTGIVGVHEQALFLIAKRWVFNNRFGKSPIKLKDNILISLSGKIAQEGDSYTELLNVKLHLKNDFIQHVNIDSIVDLDSEFIDVKSLLKGDKKALLFRLSHSKTTAQLNLTDVTPYLLLFFDEKLKFIGASCSVKSGEGSFTIQTQYKTILFVRMPNNIKLNKIISLNI